MCLERTVRSYAVSMFGHMIDLPRLKFYQTFYQALQFEIKSKAVIIFGVAEAF